MREKELRNNPWYQTRVNGFPVSHFYVPAISADRLVSAIGFSDADLQYVDSKEKYYHSWQPKKKRSDIFISYSSKNRAIADMLVEIAEKEGISCWIDTKSIGPGSYAKQIVEGIREASVFVAIVSKDAIISPHVKNELNIATSRISAGLVLMPFQIDDADLDDECSYYLGRHEFFNGKTPPIQEKIKQFVEKIKILLNGQD